MSENDEAEVERLRVENERLRAEVAEAEAAAAAAAGATVSPRRVRRTVAAVLAFVTALLLVLGIVATWTSNTALDTDKFVARVGPVINQPEVRAAITTEIGNELVSVLDVQDRVQPALPQNLQFLAGPISSGVETVVRKAVARVVDSPAFTTVWYAALRLSQEQVVNLLTGKTSNVQVVNGKVVVNLIGVISLVLENLQSQLPTIFGTALASKIPDNLPVDQIRSILQSTLGITLPTGFAQLPVMDASALESAQKGVKVVNLSVILVLVLALAAFVLALWASTNRRRTLLQVGFWTAGITAVVFFAVRAVGNSTLAGISDDVLRPAAIAAVHELFSSLRGFAILLFWLGLVLAVVMYLAGPGRFPVALRRWVSQGWHWLAGHASEVAQTEGYASWVARHLDPLRVGGVVVAALLLLLLSSWTALVVIGVLLVLYEVGVTLYARSTPRAAEEVDESVDATT